MLRSLVLGAIPVVFGVSGCLANSNGNPSSYDAGSTPDVYVPPVTIGGDVDGSAPDAADAAGDASMFRVPSGRAGGAIVAGGVRATSSGHVLLTTTGEAPAGNGVSRSSGHTLVGGVVGVTQP
jgi:hypothetical protein